MTKATAAALLFAGFVYATISSPSAAAAQQRANPTAQTVIVPQGDVPVFRVVVVGRATPSVNYRPRHGDTRIDFGGTPLMPNAKGWAEVEGDKGYITINSHFDDVKSPTQFGREYLTYVLWAITPEGRATNLGELQINGDDGRLKVTTELQAFALVVTAEPYFAVSQPSDAVVLENIVRASGFRSEERRVGEEWRSEGVRER